MEVHRELPLFRSSASVRVARDAVADVATDEGLAASMVELMRVAVSELVTNALVHGAPPYRLRVESDTVLLRVTVSDASDREPEPNRPAIADQEGRGLTILQRIADEFGWSPDPAGGKNVWFTVRRRRR